MNYLAAMLLLVLGHEEEHAFWVLACLIDDQDEGEGAGPGGGVKGVRAQREIRRRIALARPAPPATPCYPKTLPPSCHLHLPPRTTTTTTPPLSTPPPTPPGILYRDMYARDLTGTHVEMRCLRELVQHKLPRLAAHMDGLACDMSILATGEARVRGEWGLGLGCTGLRGTGRMEWQMARGPAGQARGTAAAGQSAG